MMHDVVIVGSGAAGTFAALALRRQKPLIIDVGIRAPSYSIPLNSLTALRRSGDPFKVLIGEQFESLHNLEHDELSPRIKAPLLRFVTRQPRHARPVRSHGCRIVTSYAAGGLANAWGAQVYRFNDDDLQAFPIGARDLLDCYEEVEQEIGICGSADDDLAHLHGPQTLLPPLPLGPVAADLLARYESNRQRFHRLGITIGRPRLAMAGGAQGARAAVASNGLEFFNPSDSGAYTPLHTLDGLISRGEVDYRPGWLVERYAEHGDRVEIHAVHDETGDRTTFQARVAVLCAGAVNTAGIVLRSRGDTRARLPIVENPMSMVPLLAVRHVGRPIDETSQSGQLNLFCADDRRQLVGMLYSLDGLLRSDLLHEFPFDAAGCLTAARYLLPALMLLQIFQPGVPRLGNDVRLNDDGTLSVTFQRHEVSAVEDRIIAGLRTVGWLSQRRLIRRSFPGGSIHFAGTLPMRARPSSPYETDRDCRLFGTHRIFIGDSATFPALPAKNLTLTIMSNAMRVARGLFKEPDSTA